MERGGILAGEADNPVSIMNLSLSGSVRGGKEFFEFPVLRERLCSQ